MWKCYAPLLLLSVACTATSETMEDFDWQGHRGARGEKPENTIEAFTYALDQGVKTLEMDVVISADGQVVVSHEPYMSHQTCLDPAGNVIKEQEEESYNIFAMNYAEILLFDCGSKRHPEFPDQEETGASKPLLKDAIATADAHAAQNGRDLPFYNIEIKSKPEWEGEFHPRFSEYTDEVMAVVNEAGVADRTTIQSFDKRVLQYMHEVYPQIRLSLLERDSLSPQVHLDSLGFVPQVYSCRYEKVDRQLIRFCEEKSMSLIPWTVNDPQEMQRLRDLGVGGIITDYPSRIPRKGPFL